MPTFGFSAFLKLVCLNDRPQRTEVRNRVVGRGESGYDFHAGMKRLASALAEGSLTYDEALVRATQIVQKPERLSAIQAITVLYRWLTEHASDHMHFPPALYESPARRFKLRFKPDFSQNIGPKETAIHIWNTAHPNLSDNLVRMALALVADSYTAQDHAPQDLGVLDLPNSRLILLSEAGSMAVTGHPLAARIDRLFETVEDEARRQGDLPPDRPSAPPPH